MTSRRILQLFFAALAATLTLSFGSLAGAQENPDYGAPAPSTTIDRVLSGQVESAAPGPAVSSGQASNAGGLAITGSDIARTAVIGAVLLAGGLTIVTVRRRHVA